MARHAQIDDDAYRIARALAALRERYGVSQQSVADAHEPQISKQWYAKLESGRSTGIFKPEVQRAMLAAISAAAKLQAELTLEDLSEELDAPTPSKEENRMMRMARSFGSPSRAPQAPPAGPALPTTNGAGRQAMFPLSTGDALLQLPAEMTPEAYDELEAYLQIFLKTRPKS